MTAICGPVGAYNILMLIAPPLAAWAAFLLCRHASRSWPAALLGGFIFGFSSSILGDELAGHPQMVLVFPVPLACLAAARAIEGHLRAGKLVAALAAILTVQFLISTEVLATMTMFGAAALLLSWLFAPPAMRARISGVLAPIACAYAVSAMILSPFIYSLFAFGWLNGEIWPQSAKIFSAGWADLLTPSSLALLIIGSAYVAGNWRAPLCKTLAVFLIVAVGLSWGPQLQIAGGTNFPLPGKLLAFLPFMNKALPARFMLYGFLCLAIMTSLWISTNRFSSGMRLVIGAILILLVHPDFSAAWTSPVENPPFFANGIFRNYLRRDEHVLVLPFGSRSDGMLWHAETGMYFRMVGGYTGPPPPEYTSWPIMTAFTANPYLPDAADQLGAFLWRHRVDAVIVAGTDATSHFWGSLLSQFSAPAVPAGGVAVYRILPSKLDRYRGVTALQMRQRADSAAIKTLVRTAAGWLSAGYDPSKLTATRAAAKGVLKADWCADPNQGLFFGGHNPRAPVDLSNHWFCGVWLGATRNGNITIAIYGIYGELEPALAGLRGNVSRIYFPYPRNLLAEGVPTPPPNAGGLVQIVFDRDQIMAADAQLSRRPPS
ncbi:MAG TPA: hypothetical protein VMT58_01065 [Candidatus Binataceae bacterium]|nr:hypothetical protein [Candidatus Binataceae bacterium]